MNDVSLWIAAISLLGLGLIVGSFGNVVISRVPEGRSVVRPRSACPNCGAFISPRDNIPLLSWAVLKGQCRHCGSRISPRYPAVEALTGFLWLASGAWAWWADQLPLLPLLLVWAFVGVCLTVIDLEHHRLPDALTLPMLAVTPAGLLLASFLGSGGTWTDAALGALVWFVVIGGMWAVSRGRAMGFGDVKLAPSLGAFLGWLGVGSAIVGLGLAFVVGAVTGILLLVSRRVGRRARIPFGPFLLLGAAVALPAGHVIASAYTSAVML